MGGNVEQKQNTNGASPTLPRILPLPLPPEKIPSKNPSKNPMLPSLPEWIRQDLIEMRLKWEDPLVFFLLLLPLLLLLPPKEETQEVEESAQGPTSLISHFHSFSAFLLLLSAPDTNKSNDYSWPPTISEILPKNPMRIQWESSKNLETIESLKPSLSLINLKMLYNDCIDGLICVEFNWRCANGKRRLICIICIFYISPPIIILNKNDDDDLIKHTQIIFLKSS